MGMINKKSEVMEYGKINAKMGKGLPVESLCDVNIGISWEAVLSFRNYGIYIGSGSDFSNCSRPYPDTVLFV